jgi:hypothetical protein
MYAHNVMDGKFKTFTLKSLCDQAAVPKETVRLPVQSENWFNETAYGVNAAEVF